MGQKIKKALDCAKKIAKPIVAMLVATIVLNPVVWVLCCMIAPEKAARILAELTNKTTRCWWYSRIWAVVCLAIAALLPWKSRREISKEFDFFYYRRDEVRAFDERWVRASELSSRARRQVWRRSMQDKFVICKTAELSDAEFDEILSIENDELVITNLIRKTPSKQRVKKMLNALTKADTVVSYEVKMQILEYVEKSGLPTDLALECTKEGIYSSIAEQVQKALCLYKEVEDVKQLSKADPIPWKKWLNNRNNVSIEAQAEMSDWQLKEFISIGFTLHEDLLIEYMKDETKRNWILFYVRELKEKGLLTEKAYIILITEKWWRVKVI